MSGSLLFIAVVWIVLLAPLLLRNQSPVRRTAKALTETRVLHEGGSSLQRKRRLKPAESLYQASDDDDLELVDAEPEFFLIDDAGERPKSLKERTLKFGRKQQATAVVEEAEASETAEQAEAGSVEDDVETVDAEVITDATELDNASDDALFTGSKDEKAQQKDSEDAQADSAETIDGEVVDEDAESEAAADAETIDSEAIDSEAVDTEAQEATTTYRSQDETATGKFSPVRLVVDSEDETAEASEADEAGADEVAAEPAASRHADIPVAYFRGSDLDATADIEDGERGVEQGDKEAAAAKVALAEDKRLSAEYSRDELDDEDMEYLESRRGRGVYDPVASKAAAERRLKRRKQVLAVLVGLCLVSLIAGVIVGGLMWIAPVIALGVTALYLYFLRVNAVEEARMRQRRIARMRRARLGVRNTEDQELGIPNRLLRPGAVIVESDDSDPEFEHLEYIHGGDYFDDYDRNGGYGSHDSHTRVRAV